MGFSLCGLVMMRAQWSNLSSHNARIWSGDPSATTFCTSAIKRRPSSAGWTIRCLDKRRGMKSAPGWVDRIDCTRALYTSCKWPTLYRGKKSDDPWWINVPSNFWRRNGTAKNSSVNLEEPDERLAWLLAKRSMMLVDVIEKEHSGHVLAAGRGNVSQPVEPVLGQPLFAWRRVESAQVQFHSFSCWARSWRPGSGGGLGGAGFHLLQWIFGEGDRRRMERGGCQSPLPPGGDFIPTTDSLSKLAVVEHLLRRNNILEVSQLAFTVYNF